MTYASKTGVDIEGLDEPREISEYIAYHIMDRGVCIPADEWRTLNDQLEDFVNLILERGAEGAAK